MRKVNPRMVTLTMIIMTVLLSGLAIFSVTLLNSTDSVAPTDSGAALEQDFTLTTPPANLGTVGNPNTEAVRWEIVGEFPEMKVGQSLGVYNNQLYIFGSRDTQFCYGSNLPEKSSGVSFVRLFNGTEITAPTQLFGGIVHKDKAVVGDNLYYQAQAVGGSGCNRIVKHLASISLTGLIPTGHAVDLGIDKNDATLHVAQTTSQNNDQAYVFFSGGVSNPDIVTTAIKPNPDNPNLPGFRVSSTIAKDIFGGGAGNYNDGDVTDPAIVVGNKIYFNASRWGGNGILRVFNIITATFTDITLPKGKVTNTALDYDPDTGVLYVGGFEQGSSTAKAYGIIYAVDTNNDQVINDPSEFPEIYDAKGIWPTSIKKYKDKLYISNLLDTVASSQGITECQLESSGKIKSCKVFERVPGIGGVSGQYGGMTDLEVYNDNLYGIGYSQSKNAGVLYKLNPDGARVTMVPQQGNQPIQPLLTGTGNGPQITQQQSSLPQCKNQYYDQRFVGNNGYSYFQRCNVNSSGGLAECSGFKTPIPYNDTQFFGNLGALIGTNTIVGSSDFVYYNADNSVQTLSQKYVDSSGSVFTRKCTKPQNGFGITGCDGGNFTAGQDYKNKPELGLPATIQLAGIEEIFYNEGSSQRYFERLITTDKKMYARFCSNIECQNSDQQSVSFFEIPGLAGTLGLPANYVNIGSSDVVTFSNGQQLFYQRLISEQNQSFSRTCKNLTNCNDDNGQPLNFQLDNPSLGAIASGVTFKDPTEFRFCSDTVLGPIINPQITTTPPIISGVEPPTGIHEIGSPPGGGPVPPKTPTTTVVGGGLAQGQGGRTTVGGTFQGGGLPDTAMNPILSILMPFYASLLLAFGFFIQRKNFLDKIQTKKRATSITLEEKLLDDSDI